MLKSRTKSEPGSPAGSTTSNGSSSGGGGGGSIGGSAVCPLRGALAGNGGLTTDEHGKAYPSISAAYWLPAPSPTPYQVPGK